MSYSVLWPEVASRQRLQVFHCWVGSAGWIIRTFPGPSTNAEPVAYYEAQGNGSEMRWVAVMATNYDMTEPLRRKAEQIRAFLTNDQVQKDPRLRERGVRELQHLTLQLAFYQTNKTKPKSDSVARVLTGAVPPFDDSLISVVWVALASGYYFSGFAGQETGNWFDYRPNAIAQPSAGVLRHVRFTDSSFRLPLELDYGHPSNPAYGFVKYTATATTNFLGTVLPLSFQAERFIDARFLKGGKDLLLWEIAGVVEGVRPASLAEANSEVSRLQAAVEDERFLRDPKVGRPLQYLGPPILTIGQVQSLPAYRASAKQVSREQRASSLRPWLMAAFLLLALAPAAWLVRIARKTRNTKSDDQ